jgi:hypothetical protein
MDHFQTQLKILAVLDGLLLPFEPKEYDKKIV